jgi:hypothetical protein
MPQCTPTQHSNKEKNKKINQVQRIEVINPWKIVTQPKSCCLISPLPLALDQSFLICKILLRMLKKIELTSTDIK